VDSAFRVLEEWIIETEEGDSAEDGACDRIRAYDLDGCALIAQSIGEMGRYGAGDVAVAVKVQETLNALAAKCGGALAVCAKQQGSIALARAEHALPLEFDRERVSAAAAKGA
jgi:uncharacterized membrane protein